VGPGSARKKTGKTSLKRRRTSFDFVSKNDRDSKPETDRASPGVTRSQLGQATVLTHRTTPVDHEKSTDRESLVADKVYLTARYSILLVVEGNHVVSGANEGLGSAPDVNHMISPHPSTQLNRARMHSSLQFLFVYYAHKTYGLL
jgi:hypothetical protein